MPARRVRRNARQEYSWTRLQARLYDILTIQGQYVKMSSSVTVEASEMSGCYHFCEVRTQGAPRVVPPEMLHAHLRHPSTADQQQVNKHIFMCVSMWKHTWAKESAVTMGAGEETHAVAALVISDVHAISGSRGCRTGGVECANKIHPFVEPTHAQQTHGLSE